MVEICSPSRPQCWPFAGTRPLGRVDLQDVPHSLATLRTASHVPGSRCMGARAVCCNGGPLHPTRPFLLAARSAASTSAPPPACAVPRMSRRNAGSGPTTTNYQRLKRRPRPPRAPPAPPPARVVAHKLADTLLYRDNNGRFGTHKMKQRQKIRTEVLVPVQPRLPTCVVHKPRQRQADKAARWEDTLYTVQAVCTVTRI